MTPEAWIGVVALVVGVVAIVIQQVASRSSDKIQAAQATAINALLEIERHRAHREHQAELIAAEEAEADAAFRLTADIDVYVPLFPANESRHIDIMNHGPHAATLLMASIRNGDPGEAAIVESWPEATDHTIEAGGELELPLTVIGSGQAWIDLRWIDGRDDEQATTIELNLPRPGPWYAGSFNRDMPSWLRGRR